MKINILIDNDSWIIPYGKLLQKKLYNLGHECNLFFNQENLSNGDILILMGCTKIFKKLNLHKNNIVVHESALPKGRGWSPLTWQILEGKNTIPISLFEATKKVDAGDIYLTDNIELTGYELCDEIKKKQGEKTIEMLLHYIENYNSIIAVKQQGSPTFYKRRQPSNSELDIHKSIEEQFNLLRVCDNKRYPLFFYKNNYKYEILIKRKTNIKL